jgi:hypothetical protein
MAWSPFSDVTEGLRTYAELRLTKKLDLGEEELEPPDWQRESETDLIRTNRKWPTDPN